MEGFVISVSKHFVGTFPSQLSITSHHCTNFNPFMFADEFRKSTSYITQEDRLQLLLTVYENMKIAADLKLGPTVSAVEKNSRVSI